jgi:Protein of unknown function (DUF2905)
MIDFGKILMVLGVVLLVLGLILVLAGRIPWLGHLPGDIYIQRDRFTFYFPIVTCLIVSVLISLVLYFLRR